MSEEMDELVVVKPVVLDLVGLAALAPRDRMDALISRPDAKAAVRSLAPFSLFHLLAEVGLNDATELALLASPEQVQSFMDLACWRRDRVSDVRVAEWLGLYLQLEDDKEFERVIRDVDGDLLAILLKEHTQIHLVIDDEGEPNPVLEFFPDYEKSPDGVYAIIYGANESVGKVIRALLARIFAVDLVLGHTILESSRWDLRTPMEESAYQLRRGRLEEMGFVDLEEAMGMFAWLDPERYTVPTRKLHRTVTPGFLLPEIYKPEVSESFLERVLAEVSARAGSPGEDPSDAIRFTLATIANASMVVEGADPANLEATRHVLSRTRGYTTIALEYLSKRSVEAAADAIECSPLRDLFRVGHSLVAKVQTQAKKLVERSGVAGNLSLVDGSPLGLLAAADRLLVEGLLRRRPEIVHRDHEIPSPFAALADVEEAVTRLAILGFKIVAVFGVLELDREAIAAFAFDEAVTPPVEAVELDTLIGTIVALGGGDLRPLSLIELSAFVRGPLAEQGEPTATELYRSAIALLVPGGALDASASAVAHRVVAEVVAGLRRDLAGLDPAAIERGEIEPKFLGSRLLVRG